MDFTYCLLLNRRSRILLLVKLYKFRHHNRFSSNVLPKPLEFILYNIFLIPKASTQNPIWWFGKFSLLN